MKNASYLLAAALGLYTISARADQDGIIFDIDSLKSRGISSEVAEYFSKAPRFAPGTNYVGLYVNGVKLGTTAAAFDGEGQLCVDRALLDKSGVAWPEAQGQKTPEPTCLDLHKAWPTATVTLRPGLNQVELLVPPQALTATGPAPVYASGGRAAMLNYRLFDMRNTGSSSGTNTFYADLESGLNIGDWILRSHDIYSGDDGRKTFQHVQAYVQKTFVSYKSTAQLGQLNLNSALFSAPSFTGIQAFPEGALAPANSGTSVSGIAQTPARVEIRQSAVLIYSTLVPAGPFTIKQVPLLNSSADLQVTVVESTGEQRSFVVPATSFASNFAPSQKGVSWAIGKPRALTGDADTLGSAWFMSATGTLPVGHANVTTGLMLADRYRAIGSGVDGVQVIGANGYLRGVYAHDERIAEQGERLESGIDVPLGKSWSVSTSVRQQSVGYRDLTDMPDDHPTYNPQNPFAPILVWDRSRLEFSASASYTNPWLGGVSVGFNQSQQFHGGRTHGVNASWNRSFGKVNLTVNGDINSGYDNDRRIYVSFSMPLGSASVSADFIHDGSQTQSSLRLNQQINDYVGYDVSASTQSPSSQQSYTANLSLLPKYTELDLGVAANDGRSRSYSGTLSGGVVFDGGEPLFSSQQIQDTYAVVSASQLPGVRIQTPAGPAWTDSAGRAVAASLMPYSESRLALQTKGLPRNVDIKNGVQVVEAGRGSVSHINFTAVRLRRVLLTVRDTQGQPLPTGLGVLDNSNHYLSIVGPGSQVFVDADRLKTGVFVKPENGQPCRLEATLNKQPKDVPYEQAQAICRPVAAIAHPIS